MAMAAIGRGLSKLGQRAFSQVLKRAVPAIVDAGTRWAVNKIGPGDKVAETKNAYGEKDSPWTGQGYGDKSRWGWGPSQSLDNSPYNINNNAAGLANESNSLVSLPPSYVPNNIPPGMPYSYNGINLAKPMLNTTPLVGFNGATGFYDSREQGLRDKQEYSQRVNRKRRQMIPAVEDNSGNVVGQVGDEAWDEFVAANGAGLDAGIPPPSNWSFLK